MIKRYKFSNINESEVDNNISSINDIVKAATDKGIGKPRSTHNVSLNGWNAVVLIYGNNSDGDNYIYSCDRETIINDDPVNIIVPRDSYFIVGRFKDPNNKNKDNMEYNFLNEDGFAFDEWWDKINDDFDSDGYYLAYNDDELNVINAKGRKRIKGKNEILDWYEDCVFCENKNTGLKCLYDKNGNVILDPVVYIQKKEFQYDGNNEYFYSILGGTPFNTYIYDQHMNLIVGDVDFLYYDDKYYNIKKKNFYNIIGKKCRLVFGDDPNSISGWLDKIERIYYGLYNWIKIKRDGKYNLFNLDTYDVAFDEWLDEIVILNLYLFDGSIVAALKVDEKCNIYMLDPDNDKYCEFLFDEPVDDISEYDGIIFVKKNNVNYLVLKGFRLINIKCNCLFRGEKTLTYTIKTDDGKFDFVNCEYDKTFCEMFMDGNKFDNCFDVTGIFPLVEYKGKYGYINALLFNPLFDYFTGGKMFWFDDAEPAIECDTRAADSVYPVVINGKKIKLDYNGTDVDNPENLEHLCTMHHK